MHMKRYGLALMVVAMGASASGGVKDGKAVYTQTCAACHASGVAGAPKLGDRVAWAERLKAGEGGLITSVLKGKGAMPPKGGNASLSDADVRAAVDYMIRMNR
jgi:cytochrome c5